MSDELDPRWHTISRLQPEAADLKTLLGLLKHDDWQVRFNAARELASALMRGHLMIY
jgi:hypothetical protein